MEYKIRTEKNIDKELIDGTMRKYELKAELLHSVKQCIKKLELDEKDAITITDSIMDKLCDKENSNKNPSALLKEIVVKELVEARMENFLKKVKELNNDVPNSSMTRTSSTASMYSLNGRRAGS